MAYDRAMKRWFVLLMAVSPWFWMLINKPAVFEIHRYDLLKFMEPARLSDINWERGQTRAAGVGQIGLAVVNKYTRLGQEMAARIWESLDADYLFFRGDIDPARSTRQSGEIYLFMVPLIILGWAGLSKNKKLIYGGITLGALFVGGFSGPHYFTPLKIPFLIILTIIAALGADSLIKQRGRLFLKYGLVILAIWETTRFLHDYYLHYPTRF